MAGITAVAAPLSELVEEDQLTAFSHGLHHLREEEEEMVEEEKEEEE